MIIFRRSKQLVKTELHHFSGFSNSNLIYLTKFIFWFWVGNSSYNCLPSSNISLKLRCKDYPTTVGVYPILQDRNESSALSNLDSTIICLFYNNHQGNVTPSFHSVMAVAVDRTVNPCKDFLRGHSHCLYAKCFSMWTSFSF